MKTLSKIDLLLFKESGIETAFAQISNLERISEKLLGQTPSMRGKCTFVLNESIDSMINDRRQFVIFHILHLYGVDADAYMIDEYLREHPEAR